MKASPSEQAALLELQQVDLQSMRTAHKMAEHPLRDKLAELAGRADDLRRFGIALDVDLNDQRREVIRLEDEIEKVRTRRDTQQERLDQGKVPMRDMSAVEHEIRRIVERKEELEATLLEKMEEVEAKESALADTQHQMNVLSQDEEATQKQLEAELEAPKNELSELESRRASLRSSIPTDVVAEYDRLVGRQGPLVVVEMRDGFLVNAPVSVSMEEADRASRTPADELVFSDETGFMVVRRA